ncbi:MAG: glycan-binding surface protein [Bacteroidales bacterium]|nr:glycan-binding surface protein [Bacteroidales bacterium]
MKTFFRYIALTALATLGATTLASCSDDTDADKDRGQLPVIKYVRDCRASLSDSLIVSASLGSHICFVGDNLGDVQQVWFNDQKAKLNPTMVTSHTIICDIPSVIPSEVTNNVRFVTSTGLEANYYFEVVVPGPRIDEMSLEYAKPGTTVTISGTYFVDDPNVPLTVTFTGGVEAQVTSVSQTAIKVVIPEGAQPGPITITTIYGTTISTLEYMDPRGMLFDFDGLTGLGNHGWHDAAIETDDNAISGNYVRLGSADVTMSADGGWDDGHYAFEYWPGDWSEPTQYPADGVRLYDIVDFSDWKNMGLKFELCVPSANAWQAGAMQLIFAGTNLVTTGWGGIDIYGNAIGGPNNDYFQDASNPGYPRGLYRPWSATSAFHTNDEWITVTVPFSEFVYDMSGGNATQGLTAESFASFVIFVTGGGVTGVECQPVIKIDNIRAVAL